MRPDPSHIDAHQHRDRNRESDGDDSPGAVSQRVRHNERNNRHEDDHDSEHRYQCGEARDGSYLILRHLSERFAVASDRRCENHEVLNCSAERYADDYPEGAGKKAELCGESGTDERTRARDGCEVMTKDYPAIRRNEITRIVEPYRRSCSVVPELEDARSDDLAVKPVGHHIGADRRGEEPRCVHRLTARKGEPSKAARTE